MKRVEYFNTKEELERYYENGVPSTVLAIVQPDAETAAVLYTSSNNSPVDPGQTESQGGGIVPTGTYSISENGEYEISTYSYVDVDVQGGGVTPSGYAYVTTNGDHNVAAYEMVNVDVPIPAGYIQPSGTKSIMLYHTYENRELLGEDVSTYSYVDIQVMSGHNGQSAKTAYTVAEAISRFSSASQDDFIYGEWLSDVTYVTGIISKIHEISTQYHNCTFTISDDGTYEISGNYVDGADNLLLYRQGMESGVWNMPSDTAPKVGDKITVYGKWTGTTDYVIDEGFSTYWDNGANAYCGVSSLYREAPSGGYTVTQNGSELDLSSYSYVTVNVPTGVVPTGTKTIAENGTHDVASYAYAYVSITGTTGTQLTEVFGADEYNSNVYIPFTDEGDYFSYQFTCDWDGSDWTGSLSNAGFALVGRMGSATQRDYDDQTGQKVLHNSYTAIQMHIANGAMYLGDCIWPFEVEYDEETGEIVPQSGSFTIATDLYPNTKFSNNGFGAGPENLDMSAWADGTLDFELRIPKNLPVNYDTCIDEINENKVPININHPAVELLYTWNGTPVEETFTCPNCGAEIDHEPVSGDPCPDCGYPDNEEPEEEPEE